MDDKWYLIPANAKKSILIFGMFRQIDAIILGSGIGITVMGLLLVNSINLGNIAIFLVCIPMLLALLLVVPIPYYHNTLVAIQSILTFRKERKIKYIWKGWCLKNEFKK